MALPSMLIAGRKGKIVEVEQVDLFRHRIGTKEFNISIHTEPKLVGSQSERPLAVSLYETGCKIASLPADEFAVVPGGIKNLIPTDEIRLRALSIVESLMAEIGTARLSALLDHSLSQQDHYNQ